MRNDLQYIFLALFNCQGSYTKTTYARHLGPLRKHVNNAGTRMYLLPMEDVSPEFGMSTSVHLAC